jgi:hypothetical protein
MAQFTVVERSFINDRLAEVGDIVEYDGEVSDNLKAVKTPKTAA